MTIPFDMFNKIGVEKGKPRFLKMRKTKNIKQAAVKKFAEENIEKNSTIISDDYRSYVPALKNYLHQPTAYKIDSESLGWLHTMVGNAKAFILGTYHGLPEKNLDAYLEEFCFRFSRRPFKESLFDRVAIALTASTFTELKG